MKWFFATMLMLFGFGVLHAQKVVYISNDGSNSNAGYSPNSPRKSIEQFERGKTYLFRRGDTFYMKIPGNIEGDSKQGIAIDSYGEGQKPIFSQYKIPFNYAWEKVSVNIWRIDLLNSKNYIGYVGNRNTNVGFVKIGKNIYGNKIFSLSSLKLTGDFYSDSRYLYIFFPLNMLQFADPISIATQDNIIQLSSNMKISNIALQGTGAHGISGADITDVVIENVKISEIGGSRLNSEVRYGNGIQFYNSAHNCIVQNCSVTQVYDAAFTMQGQGNNQYFDSIAFRRNYAKDNGQSFEVWIKGYKSGFIKCSFTNNQCVNAGGGWSQKASKRDVGVHLLVYSWEVAFGDLEISDNDFVDAVSAYSYLNLHERQSNLFKSDNNKIRLRKGVPLRIANPAFKLIRTNQLNRFGLLEKNSKIIIR